MALDFLFLRPALQKDTRGKGDADGKKEGLAAEGLVSFLFRNRRNGGGSFQYAIENREEIQIVR